MTKKVCGVVPDSTTWVAWADLDTVHVMRTWHKVYWPPLGDDFVAYDYGDAHFRHAWTVCEHYAYFENQDEAVQFALLFCGAP